MFKVSIRFLLNAKKSINVLSLISFLALSLGVCAMLVILCVMAGFEQEMRNRLYMNSSHLVFKNANDALIENLEKDKRVISISSRLQGELLISIGHSVQGTIIHGKKDATQLRATDALAVDLGIYEMEEGDEILLGFQDLTPDPSMFGATSRKYYLPLQGVIGDPKLADARLIEMPLRYAQSLLKDRRKYNEIELQVTSLEAALDLAKEYPVHNPYTWLDREASLFYSLKLERIAMAILLSLIVLVASFTIVSSIGMTAMEKIKELAVLRCLGLSRRGLMKILHQIGLILGGVGVATGIVLGLFLCILLKTTNIVPLPDIYVDRTLPVLIKTNYVVGVSLLGFGLVFVASLFPARFAGKSDMISAIRK